MLQQVSEFPAPPPFRAGQCSIVWVDHSLLIPSPNDGSWGCFHLLATVSDAAKGIGVPVPVLAPSMV